MRGRLISLPRPLHVLAGLATGGLLFLSFPPVNCWPLAWVACVPLLVLTARHPAKSVVPAYLGGALFFIAGIEWVRHGNFYGMLLLGLFLGLYLAAFAMAAGLVRRRVAVPLGLLAPVVWVALEAVRSNFMTGFPYLLLGHTQIDTRRLIQVIDVTGVYGVSFIVMAVNGFLADVLMLRAKRRVLATALSGALAAAGVAGAMVYGQHRVQDVHVEDGPEVCVVQINTPQSVKNRWTLDAAELAFSDYARSTYFARKQAQTPSPLVIWPETALPDCYNDSSSEWISELTIKLERLMRVNEIDRMLIGMAAQDLKSSGREVFNSAIYILGKPGVYERYDKMHLVPFGEYIPLAKLLFFLKQVVPYEQPFSMGRDYKIFEHDGRTFAVVICYEDIFPGLVRRFVSRGAEFLVNISNEGWFYESAEADQHLAIARCRAIECRRGMVRATNSGISCLIDPLGRVVKAVEKNGRTKLVDGWLTGRVPLCSGQTVYVRVGDAFALACCAAFACLAVLAWLARPRPA